MLSLQVFGFIRQLSDEVGVELVRDMSRSVRFLCYSRKKELFFWRLNSPPIDQSFSSLLRPEVSL